MTKYEEFLERHLLDAPFQMRVTNNKKAIVKSILKQELDEVIEERLHEFAEWNNSKSNSEGYIQCDVENFLQRKEE